MVRKRTYPRGREGSLESSLRGIGLSEVSKRQDRGKGIYGDAVLSKEDRLGQSQIFFVGVSSPQQSFHLFGICEDRKSCLGPKQVTYIPPARVVPSAGEISEVLSDMTRDIVIPEEEMRLVDEARRLGWSWQRIANELQGRTPKQLMRAYSEPRTSHRYVYDPTRTVRPRVMGPPPPLDQSSRLYPALRRPPLPPPLASFPPTKTRRRNVGGIKTSRILRSHRRNGRKEDDHRVSLTKLLDKVPEEFTGLMVHHHLDISSIKFYEEARIVDVDDPSRIFSFSLQDMVHCACFNIGEGEDGSPLLSWSDLYAFYQLPDGTKWAEHGYLYDKEDLETFANKSGKVFAHLIPDDMSRQELIKKKGRFHSRLCNIEHECWIYQNKLPEDHSHQDDDYFYRIVFDPTTMMRVIT